MVNPEKDEDGTEAPSRFEGWPPFDRPPTLDYGPGDERVWNAFLDWYHAQSRNPERTPFAFLYDAFGAGANWQRFEDGS